MKNSLRKIFNSVLGHLFSFNGLFVIAFVIMLYLFANSFDNLAGKLGFETKSDLKVKLEQVESKLQLSRSEVKRLVSLNEALDIECKISEEVVDKVNDSNFAIDEIVVDLVTKKESVKEESTIELVDNDLEIDKNIAKINFAYDRIFGD